MRRELKGLGLNSCLDSGAVEEGHVVADESRFTLFQSDGHIGARREADEVMQPSCLVPTVPACGGGTMIWGCCSWSGLASATLCAQRMRSADYLNIVNDQVTPSMDFFPPWWHGYTPRRQCQDSSGSNCERAVQGAWDIIFTHGPQSADLNPTENLWDVLEKALRSGLTLPSSIQYHSEKWMQHWMEINLVTLQKLIETMPQRMGAIVRAKRGPTKYQSVWPFVFGGNFLFFGPGSVYDGLTVEKEVFRLFAFSGGYVSPQIVRKPQPFCLRMPFNDSKIVCS